MARLGRAVGMVAFVVVMAGCGGASGSSGAGSSSVAPAAPPTATGEYGSVTGTVLDDETRPVAGADVGLIPSAVAQTRTDDLGLFTFNDVPPGSYSLVAQRLGFREATLRVTVVAGEVTEAKLVLVPIPVVEPQIKKDQKQGKIMCSYYAVASWSWCPYASTMGTHTPTQDFDVEAGNTWRMGELVWTGTHALAPQQLWMGEYNQARTAWGDRLQGPSPLTVQTEQEFNVKDGKPVKTRWAVFVASSTTPTLAWDQPYTMYYSAFYHMPEIPEGYTALPPS